MNRRFLNKFTKHLVLAAKKYVKEEPEEKKPILSRKIPPIPIPVKVRRKPLQLEPTISLPKMPEMKDTIELSLEELAASFPKSKQTLSFGKLSQFVEDISVKIIECPGPDKKIKLKKLGGVMETGTTLNAKEIEEIINIFSAQTKALLTQIFKAKFNNLSITAFISPVSGTKFMILKD